MKTILSIQSQVAHAGVGNSIAVFAMQRLGVRVIALPTTLLGRRPDRGDPGGGPLPKETLKSLLEGLDADGALANIGAVISGYVGDAEQVEIILDAVERVRAQSPGAVYVCDPVLGDDGRSYVSPDIADAIINGLVPRADWLTPNFFEFGMATNREIKTLDAARDVARYVGRPVLVSSIPSENGVGVLYAAPGGDWYCETPLLPSAPKGAGDLLTALFTARRIKGEAPAVALEASVGALYDVLVRTLALQRDEIAVIEAQDLLVEPKTWPKARALTAP